MIEDVRQINNTTPKPITVWLEPWASDYEVLPGDCLRIVGRSVQEGRLEVVDYDDRVGVYAWAGASIQVFRGDELLAELPKFYDDAPPGNQSMRWFIENLFGGPGEVGENENVFSSRYSRRAMLIVVALVAVVLGLVVWMVR